MTSKEDLESYLLRMGVEYEEVDDNMWLLKPQDTVGVVVNYTPPVVLLRLKVMELPPARNGQLAPFYRRLLELNASDLVHGSYGIEQNSNAIVLTEALELSHLDYEEFLAAYESMTLALASHLREIGSYRGGQ